jgi:TldD protein
MTLHSRRTFLATTSFAVAGLSLGARRLPALPVVPRTTPRALLPDPTPGSSLRALAARAIDAARQAGATYADVRVAERQQVKIVKLPGFNFQTDLSATFAYGLRVFVNGSWSFASGVTPSADALTSAARHAVARARANVVLGGPQEELVPVAVETGEWAMPMKIDPFTVPLHDQMALLGSWSETAGRILGVAGAYTAVDWVKESRVIATTDGVLVTQHLTRSSPAADVYVDRMRGGNSVSLQVPNLLATSGGYETVIGETMYDRIVANAEEANRWALMPARQLDVGRYPIVVDGVTFGCLLYRTIGQASEMDRVIGEEADASGTTFLSPASDFLGTHVTSPLLTVTTDRAMPSVTGVKWDDEGITPVPRTLVRDGVVVDYHMARRHVNTLRSSYQRQGFSPSPCGATVAPEANAPVQVRCGHLTVAPSAHSASTDDLVGGMSRGILIKYARYTTTDQQLKTGSLTFRDALMLHVERGRVVRRIKGVALQFNVLPLLKSLTALGDATTTSEGDGATFKGVPWYANAYHTTAPSAAFKEVDVIDISRST